MNKQREYRTSQSQAHGLMTLQSSSEAGRMASRQLRMQASQTGECNDEFCNVLVLDAVGKGFSSLRVH